MDGNERGSSDWVTWREMTDHVEAAVKPIRDRAQAHDDWHRGLLQAQNRSFIATLLSLASTGIAGWAVYVASTVHH